MKVYLDLVFIVNFGINLIFLAIIQVLFNEKLKLKRGILSSIIASLLLLVYFFNFFIFYLAKLLGGFLLIWLGVGSNKMLMKSSLFYLFEFGLTGMVQSYQITGVYLVLAIFILTVLIMLQSFKNQSIFINHFKYNISVTLGKNTYNLSGFLDTGNMLHIQNTPVVFLDKKYLSPKVPFFKQTFVKTVSGINEINCYKPDHFTITIDGKRIEKEVLIAFTSLEHDFDCLLNYHLFI